MKFLFISLYDSLVCDILMLYVLNMDNLLSLSKSASYRNSFSVSFWKESCLCLCSDHFGTAYDVRCYDEK